MIAIIQSRYNSKRLFGKALKKIVGAPMLLRVVERLKSVSDINKVIVATSTQTFDDNIVNLCKKHNINFFRGSLKNVSKRFRDLINKHSISDFIRISGDSPLIHHDTIDNAIKIYKSENKPVITNIWPRSFPKGQTVEIINSKHFLRCYDDFNTDYEYEHVTPGVYRLTDKVKISNFTISHNFSDVQLSVDNEFDLDFMNSVYKRNDFSSLKIEELVYLRQKFEKQHIS